MTDRDYVKSKTSENVTNIFHSNNVGFENVIAIIHVKDALRLSCSVFDTQNIFDS